MELLVKRAKKHDKQAFSELMRGCSQNMYKIDKAILKNDDDIADAMQETALTCWEKIDTLKKPEFFKTWMTKILINECNAILRQRKRIVFDEYTEASAVEDAYAEIEWKEFLKQLEEKYRIVVILYYVEGFKIREVAQFLDISEGTVKSRMAVARKKMEELYYKERRFKII